MSEASSDRVGALVDHPDDASNRINLNVLKSRERRMDLTWGKQVASTDRWVGSIAGVWVSTETLRVSHLLIKRGWLFPSRLIATAEALDRCDDDGLYLRLSTLDILGLPASSDAYRDATAVVLQADTRLETQGAAPLRVAGLRVSSTDLSVTHLLVRRQWPSTVTRLLSIDWIEQISPWRLAASLDMGRFTSLPRLRPDGVIERDVWDALTDSVSPLDLEGIDVGVTAGTATLKGNVRLREASDTAAAAIERADGVVTVDDQLITDRDVELAVASEIAALDPALSGMVEVRSHLGTVELRGSTPSDEVHDNVIQASAGVHGVRKIENSLVVRQTLDATEPEPAEDRSVGTHDAEPVENV